MWTVQLNLNEPCPANALPGPLGSCMITLSRDSLSLMLHGTNYYRTLTIACELGMPCEWHTFSASHRAVGRRSCKTFLATMLRTEWGRGGELPPCKAKALALGHEDRQGHASTSRTCIQYLAHKNGHRFCVPVEEDEELFCSGCRTAEATQVLHRMLPAPKHGSVHQLMIYPRAARWYSPRYGATHMAAG